ncbi:hypothetical protein [Elongatibacter sediminis]|uniref:Uncharacterized protein n=1 Tax=Elongatibacter sediminis TaxID=3119006 RepID=A0AAW9RQ72_9GAMM
MSADQTDLKRWTRISLRTLHLIAVAGVGGGILFGLAEDLWRGYWWLALTSGGLMMLMDLVSSPVWLVQVRGVAIVTKLFLLVLLGLFPQWGRILLVTVIVISGAISHAPGKVRYYSLLHRRVIN